MAEPIDMQSLGAPGRVRTAIKEGAGFQVRLPSWLAALIPTSVGAVGLTLVEASVIVALAGLAVFGGLAVYAISKGYVIRRVDPDGEVWEFTPPRPT